MKHVTLFSQLAEYQTFMGGGDGLKPNVSYVREDSKVYSTGAASEDFSGAVVYARYNITEDMSKTGLFSTSNVKALKVDGEVMEFEPEAEMSDEITVLGENISFDMENETYNIPEEYLFDNTKLSTLVVRPANGDVSAYNAVCLSISIGGMNYPMPLMFEEAAEMGIVVDYENNMVDLSPMLEMMSMYYPGNSSACLLSVDENYETLIFGDTLVSLSGISGGMPAVFDFESTGEHELEILLKDGESLRAMFTNNFEADYGLIEVIIPDTIKYLDENCFAYDNNLSKVTIPVSVESIGENSFYHCSSLTDVCFLGEGVKIIGSYAFQYCENLTTISLPDSIETLEYCAFYECRRLTSVKLSNGISTLDWYTFNNCVALDNVVIPDSVTVIDDNCFNGCSGLTSVTIKSQAIASMSNLHKKFGTQVTTYIFGDGITSIGYQAFYSCNNLVSVTLPDGLTSIGDYAFCNCGNLASIKFPDSLTTIGDSAFDRCISLETIAFPDSLTTIGYHVFYGCSGLTSINFPDGLESIGNGTFAYCTNLTTITLPAHLKTVGMYAFQGCENLTEIYALPSTPPTNNNSFLNIPSNGVLYYPYGSDYSSWKKGDLINWEFVANLTITECTNLTITANNVKWNETTTTINYTATVNGVDSLGNIITGVVITGTKVSEEFEENQSDETIERVITFEYMGVTATTTITQGACAKQQQQLNFVALEDGAFSFTKNGTGDDIQYSKDNGVTWTALPSGESVGVSYGDKVMWKSTISPSSGNGIGTFSSTGKFEAHGSVMSLLFGDDYAERTDLTGKSYAFYKLFNGCTSLTTAPELPATTLAIACYYHMFEGCTSLTTAPELPATILANSCYYCMFYGCTSLTTAPELPATTLIDNCYHDMFRNCTSLTTAPELPATTLATGCYYMIFYGCTSLTTAPELPATTLARDCYRLMFGSCTNLTTAPELPATTLAEYCCYDMFSGCTSLTTAPSILPATTLTKECYYGMFRGCESLTAAPELPATTLANRCYGKMFAVCTSLTTAPELPATTLADYCYGDMFGGCTSLTTAPELPATTLAKYCYSYMFCYCTSLTTAPELLATTLSDGCYGNMFEGCTSLNNITMLATDKPYSSCLSYWVNNVPSTGTFVKHPDMTSLSRGIHGIPEGWTVENYQSQG